MRVGVFVVLALLSGMRAQVWHDELSLWKDATMKAPQRPRGLVNYGRALQVAGRSEEAMAWYQKAIQASFDNRRLHAYNIYARLSAETNMATVLLYRQQIGPASMMIDQVLANPEWPNFPYALFQRGVIKAYLGRCDEAQHDWATAYRLEGTLMALPKTVPCYPGDIPSVS